MLRNYFRIALRILARNKLYTIINVLGLALGVCGCIVIWLVGSYEMSFDRFHPDGDRIYRVGSYQGTTIPPMPEAIRKTIPGLKSVTAFFPFGRNIRHTDSLAEFVINETAAKQLGLT
jgi:putative ABC transport system permease protein